MSKNSSYLPLLYLSFHVWLSPVQAQPAPGSDFDIKDKYYAVIIGVNTYTDKTINSLTYPIPDAMQLREVLVKDYQFESPNIYLLTNPTRQQIFDAFGKVNNEMDPTDNLLIFYAGHGEWSNKTGFWWPSDVRKNSISQKISSNEIKFQLNQLVARHILLIIDACYSGAVFQSRGESPVSYPALEEMYTNTSRMAITSGNLVEVPDQGLFANALIKKLKINPYRLLPAGTLFHEIREEIINQETKQKPEFGRINDVEDEGGEFIFTRRNARKDIPTTPVNPTPVKKTPLFYKKEEQGQGITNTITTSPLLYKKEVLGQGISSIIVSAKKGDKIAISASGMIEVGRSVGYAPPAGKVSMRVIGIDVPIATSYNLIPKWPHAALIYRTSADPKDQWKLCGDKCEIIAPVSGELEVFFQLNDAQQTDNSGNFTLEISIDK